MVEAIERKAIKLNLEKAEVWLNEHWKGDRVCPICGNRSWSGHDEAMEIRSFDEGRLGAKGPVILY